MATNKRKTHRGAAKRFVKTASGKFKRGQAMRRHILTKKSAGRKRKLAQGVIVAKGDEAVLRKMLPYA